MAIIPKSMKLTQDSVKILNAIRNGGSQQYRSLVPVATDRDSIRGIGQIITSSPVLQNEFLSALWNRIGAVIVKSSLFENPWAVFKRGIMELGETIEEIFVEISEAHQFDPEVAEREVEKREIPDVRSAFHVMNYQKFYKQTISEPMLKQAFLSANGIYDLVSRIVSAMVAAANYDEFLCMKYLLAMELMEGRFYPTTVPDVSATDNSNTVVTKFKGIANSMTFLSPDYNPAGVHRETPFRDQYLIVTAEFSAIMDVNSLATAFNMDKVEFLGHVIMVDSFGTLDISRLSKLLAGDPTYVEPSQDELDALKAIPAVIVSEDFFMVLDNLITTAQRYNEQGLYRNHFLHVWKTLSVSPFSNRAVFVPGVPSITSMSVTPEAINVPVSQVKRGDYPIVAKVNMVTENFAPQFVTWQSDTDKIVVSADGIITVKKDSAAAAGQLGTVTATSTFDPTKTATVTVTITEG